MLRARGAGSAADDRLGLVFLALSATAYGTVTVFARHAYDAGLTPLGVLAIRYLAAALLLLLLVASLRRPLLAPKAQRWAGLVAGLLLALVSWGYLASVAYIPVSVAALVFFAYPMLVVAAARLLRLEEVGWRKAAGGMVAFAGLALGLQVGSDVVLDPRGLAMAALAAVTYTALLLFTGRAGRGADWTTLVLQTNVVSALVFVPLAVGSGELALPGSPAGWTGLLGLTAGYLLGIVFFFVGIARSGPIRAAALSNLEPIVSVAGAILFLGEGLTEVQAVGIALVFLGILLMSR